MDRVLEMRDQQPLLQHDVTGLVPPDRQAGLEAELGDRHSAAGRAAGGASEPQAHRAAVGMHQPLDELVEHDGAAQGAGQRGDRSP